MSLKKLSSQILFISKGVLNSTGSTFVARNTFKVQFARYDSSFKAAVFTEAQKPLKLQEVSPKKLKKGQLRIKVHACAVNASDYLLSQGVNPSKFPVPITPGYEMSGVVLEANECEDFGKGDKVVAFNKEELGGFAEQCIVNEKDAWLMPSSLSFANAAAIIDSFGTAQLGLSRHSHILQKQIVIVTMAPAHGYAPLDLAANVYKTKVIAVATTEEETVLLRERGAWNALNYNEKRLISVVNELTANQGVNVIYDTLAGPVLKSCLKCITHEGHIIVAGFTLEELPQIEISTLLTLPSFYISGVSLRSYRKYAFPTYRQTVSDVLEMSEQKLIKPEIAQKFPLKDVNKAIQLIKEKKPVAKVILEMTAN